MRLPKLRKILDALFGKAKPSKVIFADGHSNGLTYDQAMFEAKFGGWKVKHIEWADNAYVFWKVDNYIRNRAYDNHEDVYHPSTAEQYGGCGWMTCGKTKDEN